LVVLCGKVNLVTYSNIAKRKKGRKKKTKPSGKIQKPYPFFSLNKGANK
jgi:hypothetical protein